MEASWPLLLLANILLAVFIKWLIGYGLYLRRLPPGPWGLPVLGYLPWLSNQVFKDFVRIGKQYGGMFSLRLGGDMAVVLNDWPTVKATLIDRGKAFSGRKFNHLINVFSQGKDIIYTDGKVWLKQRNLALQSLKNVGANNKKTLESRLMDMIHRMLDEMKNLDGQVSNIEEMVHDNIATGNWKIISELEVAESKEELDAINEDLDTLLRNLCLDNPVAALPWLRFLPPSGFGFWSYARAMRRYRSYLTRLIRKHYAQLDSGNDVIDNYIDEIKKHPDRKPPYNNDHLTGTVIDLVLAANETTFSTSMWGLLFLALNPQVQTKAQEELDRVVGRERLPTVEDFPNLPYLDAFIMEIHRMGCVTPVSAPHSTSETVHINGFTIPKDTLCIQNIYAIHHDPEYWEEPEVFKPERFITEDGSAKAPPYLMPFSVGPRVCLGQFVAEIELRLLFSCVLQHFTFALPRDRPTPSLEAAIAVTRKPLPYALHIMCRT